VLVTSPGAENDEPRVNPAKVGLFATPNPKLFKAAGNTAFEAVTFICPPGTAFARTNAVVANCVVLVPKGAVGAVGVPKNAGLV
jgi:hypothetical protein